MGGIIGVAVLLAGIEGRAVVRRQRVAVLQAARQVRVGDEDAAERDGIGMTFRDRGSAASPVKPPAVISTPFQIGRNSTIADGTF